MPAQEQASMPTNRYSASTMTQPIHPEVARRKREREREKKKNNNKVTNRKKERKKQKQKQKKKRTKKKRTKKKRTKKKRTKKRERAKQIRARVLQKLSARTNRQIPTPSPPPSVRLSARFRKEEWIYDIPGLVGLFLYLI